MNQAQTPAETETESKKFDVVGITASVACAIHCLATPFIFLFLPAIGKIWAHPIVHWIMAALVLPLALVVIHKGYRQHKRRLAIVSAYIGVFFILLGLVVPGSSFESTAQAHAAAPAAIAQPHEHQHNHQHETPNAPNPAAKETEQKHEHAAGCGSSCCPTITVDPVDGSTDYNMTPASIVTIIGSVFLVIGHSINIHGCQKAHRKTCKISPKCGC